MSLGVLVHVQLMPWTICKVKICVYAAAKRYDHYTEIKVTLEENGVRAAGRKGSLQGELRSFASVIGAEHVAGH